MSLFPARDWAPPITLLECQLQQIQHRAQRVTQSISETTEELAQLKAELTQLEAVASTYTQFLADHKAQ